jgi:pilus assembly protein CpaF
VVIMGGGGSRPTDRDRILDGRIDLRDELLRARRDRGEAVEDADDASRRLQERLLRRHPNAVARAALDPWAGRGELDRAVAEGIDAEAGGLASGQRRDLAAQLAARVAGLGFLQPLVDDPGVTDVLVNGPGSVWVVRRGETERAEVPAVGAGELLALCERLAAADHRAFTVESPTALVEAPGGLRVRLLRPPLSQGTAALAIRKLAPAGRLGGDELVDGGAWTADLRDFLAAVMRAGLNCLLYGPTGSGKTTNLRAMLGLREDAARVVVLEHTAELRLNLPNVVALEAVPRPGGDLTLADIFPVTLQLLPEVIVLGEILSGEALPFLNAALSGHQVLATIHAGSPELALWRLAVLASAGGLDPVWARELPARALDLLIETRRLRVLRVAEPVAGGPALDLFRLEGGVLRQVGEPSVETRRRMALADGD